MISDKIFIENHIAVHRMVLNDIVRNDAESSGEIEKAISDAVEEGKTFTIAVHSYLTPTEIELGAQGKIDIRYLPEKPSREYLWNEKDVLMFEGDQMTTVRHAQFLPGMLGDAMKRGIGGQHTIIRKTTGLGFDGVIMYAYDQMITDVAIPNYLVAAEKVRAFADMMEEKRAPQDIISYLTN